MKHLLTIFITILNFTLQAQPIRQFQFTDLNFKWSNFSYSENLPKSIQGYLLQKQPLFNDEHHFTFHNIFDKYYQGYLVEKINTSTGKTDWKYLYNTEKVNERKYGYSIKTENEKIVINAYKENNIGSNIIYPIWSRSNFNQLELNPVNGNVIKERITDQIDKDNKKLAMPFAPVFANVFTSHLFENNNNVNYVRQEAGEREIRLYNFLLDTFGHQLDSFYFNYAMEKYIRKVTTEEYKENEYLMFVHGNEEEEPTTNRQEKVFYFSKGFNHVKTIDITSFLPDAENYNLAYFDEEHFIIMGFQNIINDNDVDRILLSYSFFNHEGQLKEQVILKNYEIIGTSDNSAVTYNFERKKMLIVNTIEVNDTTHIQVFASDGNNKFEKLIESSVINENDILLINKIYWLTNFQILMNFTYLDRISGLNPNPKWSNWTMFSEDALGLPTFIKDPVSLASFTISPNPVSAFININTDVDYDEVVIYEMNGVIVLKSSGQYQVDLSNLANGTYLCELRRNGNAVSQRVKVVKAE